VFRRPPHRRMLYTGAMNNTLLNEIDGGGAWLLGADWIAVDEGGGLQLRDDVLLQLEHGRITALVPAAAAPPLPRLQLAGRLLLPGLISGHTHMAGGTVTRGIIEGGRSFALPLQLVELLDDDQLDALTAHNLFEIVRSGCTTQLEMSLSLRQAQSYVRVAARWGVRGFVGPMLPGIAALFPIWFRTDDAALFAAEPAMLQQIAAARDFLRAIDGSAGGLLRALVTPHAADTQTPATLRALVRLADELECGVHTHLSQSLRESQTVERLWGLSPLRWLQAHGLLRRPFVGAHLVGFDWATDAPLLNAAGGVYAHCPSGGGAGGPAQPYPEALGARVATNVAIDTHSNDMLENLKLSVLYGQARYAALTETSALPLGKPTIGDALAGATSLMADGLQRSDLGRIRPGAAADLVAVDVCGPLVGVGTVPREPLHQLLYANGLSVTHVLIGGRRLLWDGRLAVADEQQVVAGGARVVERIYAELAQRGWFGEKG
jgi:5-methylthioadenosine/S-adenosylhomocysteine deaminase